MLTWLIKNRIAAFEKTFGYDLGYAREILAADPRALLRLQKLAGIAQYRRDVPTDVYYAVKLVGSRAEDCGPCTQLVVTMALKAGVDAFTLAALVRDDEDVLSEPVRLGREFAHAVLAHAPEADALREEIARRWGPRAVVSLAFGLAAARVYPTVKYALGHGKACQRVVIAGTSIPVLPTVERVPHAEAALA